MMSSSAIADLRVTKSEKAVRLPLERLLFYVLAAAALVYAFVAGLKTITEFDLGWQLATGRWIAQHHQIPSTDVFSYTVAGHPWIYPVGSGLLFYGVFLLGGYALLSWLGALTCVATVALLLRKGNAASACLATLAVPLIAARTNPRAEMFTVLLFAVMLSLLWEQHHSGAARLWLLPLLMVAWVNLHPGFVAGLALLGAYAMLEVLGMIQQSDRSGAAARLRSSWPWLIATCAATLVNPWGWGVYRILLHQEAEMQAHAQSITEWASVPHTWTAIKLGLLTLDPNQPYLLLLAAVLAVSIALLRRQLGAAALVGCAVFFAVLHMRFLALLAIVVVVVGGAALASLPRLPKYKMHNARLRSMLAVGAAALFVGLAATRVTSVITNRESARGSNLASFGAGLSWWFPEKAAAFIERESIPGQIFNSYNEGGYIAWRLGPRYRDYIDGRAVPFGPGLMERASLLMTSPPDSQPWKQEAERYNINTILVPLGRYDALQFFPVLKQFCESDVWRPVYLDEVSAVFVRHRPETEALIERAQVNCSAAPLPADAPMGTGTGAFNQWANAASVLRALGRNLEAFVAARKALAIFPDSGYLHFLRGHIYQEAGNSLEAEQDYLLAAKLEPNLVAPWSALAASYQDRGRWPEAIRAWENAAGVSRWPGEPLVNLGYANLRAQRPKEALRAFERAANSLPAKPEPAVDNAFLATLAHGRAVSWYGLGDLRRAISFEEQALKLGSGGADAWTQLAGLYDRAGRNEDAAKARALARSLSER